LAATNYVRPQSGIEVDRIILRVLRECDLQPKVAAILMDNWDPASASRAAQRTRHARRASTRVPPVEILVEVFPRDARAVLLREESDQERLRA